MSASKTLFTFVTGVAAGLAAAYYVDPKGSKRKLKKIEKDLKKTRKTLDKKLDGYKSSYNEVVDKYAASGKSIIDKSKDIVDQARNSVKA